MNILFLTLLDFKSIEEHNIYTDLLREFYSNGHSVYAISPVEKRNGKKTELLNSKKAIILKPQIGNITKTNIFEKGISTLLVESNIITGIKKYFSNVKFDIVIYSTPPITFCRAVDFVKRRDGAKTYLLLKDIFPQNAVDIGILTKKGIKGIIYRFFRNKEKRLYDISDYIGCMSEANVNYVLGHNKELNPSIVEVCPNSIEVIDKSVNEEIRKAIRNKYSIPLDKKVFIYGGNLGRPQGIDFLIKCIYSQRKNKDVFFLIVGDGTEYGKLEYFVEKYPQNNLKLMKKLPKEDYDRMVGACDVGLIFLDHRFTIPNFPSRLLSYMQAKIPVFACTDLNTDIGQVIVDGEFGWWCESNNIKKFVSVINEIQKGVDEGIGINGWKVLDRKYNSRTCYSIIMKHFI